MASLIIETIDLFIRLVVGLLIVMIRVLVAGLRLIWSTLSWASSSKACPPERDEHERSINN